MFTGAVRRSGLCSLRLAQRTVLQAIFEAGSGDQHLVILGFDHALEEAVVQCGKLRSKWKQRLIARQTVPGQVRDCINTFNQAADVQLRLVYPPIFTCEMCV